MCISFQYLIKEVVFAAAEDQMFPGETLTFDLEPSIEELLQLGISRLHEKPTWKLWQWLPEEKEFLDADSFRHVLATSLHLLLSN